MSTCAGNARRGVDSRAAAERNEFLIVTSFVTLLEVLVHPLRGGRHELAEEYRNILLQSPALTAIPLDEGIAEEAAESCARHNLLSEIPVLVLKQLP
jgi:predicted nucleic acid-binding protein